MKIRKPKELLFLCTGNYYRSRFAEILFNSIASKVGLAWTASSRGLALERGIRNIGPMDQSAVRLLKARGINAPSEWSRFPMPVTADDLKKSDRVIALKEAEHLPLVQERFSMWAQKVEYWQIDDAPEALSLIESSIIELSDQLKRSEGL